MRRFTKISVAVLVTLPIHIALILAVVGVPRPPAVAVDGVGRVGWRPVIEGAEQLWRSRTSKSVAAFMPDGSGLLVWGRRHVLESRLYHVAGPGDQPVLLSSLPRNVSGLHVSPEREYAIVTWDRDGDEQHRLYRWDFDSSDPMPLTPEPERAHFGAFEPGGRRIAYSSTRRNGRDFDIYLMDPEDPATDRLVVETEGMWTVAGWSPSGSQLLLAEIVSNVHTRLYLFNPDSGELVSVGPREDEPFQHSAPVWSPDGRLLYYASNRDSEFMHLRRLDLESQEEDVLLEDIPWDVTSVQMSHDGGFLLVAVNDDGRTVYYTVDVVSGNRTNIAPFESGTFAALIHPEAPLVAFTHVDADGISRAYVYDMTVGDLSRWAGPEPGARTQSDVRLVRYPTFDEVDGERRTISAFVYPGRGDGPRPVVIDIHGGPEAQARLRTGTSPLQRVGITIITPNVRGSTGYGKTFTSLDDWYLREDAVRDIGALLDWVAIDPDLDADRVAVMGGSYGGYMVLASLVHYSPRIRCGIDVVGVSNFVTFLENTADYRRDLRRAEYGDERIPEVRAFLESIAPLNNAERITSPLMVIQGANDPRVPVGESRQLVDRVRKNGLEVAYMEGANEGHGFRHPWNAFYAGIAQQQRLRECLLDD